VFQKVILLFLNNSVAHQPISIRSGTQHPNDMCYK